MKSLFIQSLPTQTRIALREDESLTRLWVERPGSDDGPGAIFLARVTKVIPGIQAAFLDAGLKEQVFLNRTNIAKGPSTDALKKHESIETRLKVGQAIPVQVMRASVDGKSTRVSTELKLTGCCLVLATGVNGVVFSRNFKGDKKVFRQLLQQEANQNEGFGWIVRAYANKVGHERIGIEAALLRRRFQELLKATQRGSCRLLDRENCDLVKATIRDGANTGWQTIILDDPVRYEEVKSFLAQFCPEFLPALKLHLEHYPLFHRYKLHTELERALSPRVWLKTGGQLVFDQTEAMVTIDINSGKMVKGKSKDQMLQANNLEAVRQLMAQIRLRNLAGLIAVDFPDIKRPTARREIDAAFQEEAAKDEAQLHVLPMSDHGIVEMTRSRELKDLQREFLCACPTCGGSGRIKNYESLALEIQQILMLQAPDAKGEGFEIKAGPPLADYLAQRFHLFFANLEKTFEIRIQIMADHSMGPGAFDLGMA